MAELSPLDNDTARKLALKWDALVEKLGFTGEHLEWRVPVPRLSSFTPINPVGTTSVPVHLRLHPSELKPEITKREPTFNASFAGSQTIKLARERFLQLEEEYAGIWTAQGTLRTEQFVGWLDEIRLLVEGQVAALWINDERRAAWFESACRPKLQQELASLVKKYATDARKLEIQHLESKTTRSGLPEQQWDYQFQLQLDEGRKALERAARVRALCQEPLLKAGSEAQANEQTAPGRQETTAGQVEAGGTATAIAGQRVADQTKAVASQAKPATPDQWWERHRWSPDQNTNHRLRVMAEMAVTGKDFRKDLEVCKELDAAGAELPKKIKGLWDGWVTTYREGTKQTKQIQEMLSKDRKRLRCRFPKARLPDLPEVSRTYLQPPAG
jgi:hypothetical protein